MLTHDILHKHSGLSESEFMHIVDQLDRDDFLSPEHLDATISGWRLAKLPLKSDWNVNFNNLVALFEEGYAGHRIVEYKPTEAQLRSKLKLSSGYPSHIMYILYRHDHWPVVVGYDDTTLQIGGIKFYVEIKAGNAELWIDGGLAQSSDGGWYERDGRELVHTFTSQVDFWFSSQLDFTPAILERAKVYRAAFPLDQPGEAKS